MQAAPTHATSHGCTRTQQWHASRQADLTLNPILINPNQGSLSLNLILLNPGFNPSTPILRVVV